MNGFLLWIWRLAAARLFQRVVLPAGERFLVGRGALYGATLGLAGLLLLIIFKDNKVVSKLTSVLFEGDAAGKPKPETGEPLTIDIDNPQKDKRSGPGVKRLKNR